MARGAWVWTPHLRHFAGGEMDWCLGLINELEIIFWRLCMGKPDDAILRWPFFWALGLFILPTLIFTDDFGLYCDSAETRKLLATGRFMDSSGGHDTSPIFVRC